MVSRAFLDRLWYTDGPLSKLLLPLSWLFAALVHVRRIAYAAGVIPVRRLPVPVIVVGNLTVGGTGKTPLIIWLAQFLKKSGFRPGIVSRGYRGRARKWPQQVRPDSNPEMVGDEPVLIAQRTGCAVAVSPNRLVGARELVEHTKCNILLCDDGLQHLALARDIEIAVVDGDRRFGNGHCLPAGPLREPASRLHSVDAVVANARAGKYEHLMEYESGPLRSLRDDARRTSLDAFRGQGVHAVAGIGNPQRFFSYLRSHELHIIKHEFPDHHPYVPEDLAFGDDLPVVMTEKDAVKCREFAGEDFWYLPISARLAQTFEHRLTILLKDLNVGQETA